MDRVKRLSGVASLCVSGLLLASCGGSKGGDDTVSSAVASSTMVSSTIASSTMANSSSIANSSAASSEAISGIAETAPAKSAQWKRVKAIKSDLAYALDLPADKLCSELGSLPCFDQVHLSALGGNEPFVLTQYEPVDKPTAISAVVADRVALAACSNKVDSDASATTPSIFTHYDLNEMSLPGDANYLAALDAQNTQLYQRLLVRDPSAQELTLLQSLGANANGDAISNADVAKLSCYTIATSTEFHFL